MKICFLVGTRPEIIKLSEVVFKLRQYYTCQVVYTGQNYSKYLSTTFFEEFPWMYPDHFLEAMNNTHGQFIGDASKAFELYLENEGPDAILIYGDTHSAILSIIAKHRGIPIFHFEAGNRCFSDRVPEEINRSIVDTVADYNFCLTRYARDNLAAIGFPARRTFITGSHLPGVYKRAVPRIKKALQDLSLNKPFVLMSLHRAENLENREVLSDLISNINKFAEHKGLAVIFLCHPRTEKKIRDWSISLGGIDARHPVGFFEFASMCLKAQFIISDSGTIVEESSILRVPVIMLRDFHERPEYNEVSWISHISAKNIDANGLSRFQLYAETIEKRRIKLEEISESDIRELSEISDFKRDCISDFLVFNLVQLIHNVQK